MGAAIYFDFLAYCIDVLLWIAYAVFGLLLLAAGLEMAGFFDPPTDKPMKE